MERHNQKKILIVDDETDFLFLMKTYLEHEGFEVVTATNGEEGIAKTLAAKPNLVLLDIVMPKMDGFEACAALKQDERTKWIPVIFLSGRSTVEDIQKGLACGANDYVAKPFDNKKLMTKIEGYLGDK